MKTKILIIDDCASMCKLVSHFLSTDFDCSTALSAEEGMEKFEAGLFPELVLLDLNMPGMGGEALLNKMKADERYKGVKVVIVSAETQSAVKARLINSGAEDFVSKPFNPEELLARINRILQR